MSGLVIWDFDGPIFNARQARDIAFARVAEHFSPPSTDYKLFPLYSPRQTICLAYSDKNLGSDVLDEMEAYFRAELLKAEADIKVDREVLETIENLFNANCRQAILSLRSESGLIDLLERNRLTRFVGIIHARETPPANKPSPDAILSIMQKAGVDKAETLLVGDSDLDFGAAHEAGIVYLHAGWSNEPVSVARTQADQILTRPSEVEQIVDQGFTQLSQREQSRRTLKNLVRFEKFSFFAGAGVSIASGLGSWRECFLPLLKKHLPENSLTGFSLPEIVQLIIADQSRAQLIFDDFKEAFTAQREPNPYHYSMVRSACDTIWTTNYDNLFERVVDSSGRPMAVLRADEQLKDSFGTGRKLIKVHGDFYAATFNRLSMDWGVVISDEQFDLSEVNRPEIWRYFEDEYRTSSLLFVGVSFSDPTLRRILSIISRKMMRTRRSHFVLAKRPSTPTERIIANKQIEVLRQRNIHTLLFDDYTALSDFVGELCMLSRKPVITFSGTAYLSDKAGAQESAMLEEGVLSFGDIETMCGNMGATLAHEGFRVASGHGAGVGIPAVAKAYEEDRRSARYYMRKRGDTRGSRRATTIFIAEDDLNIVRQRFIQASHVVIAMGGASNQGSESGTVREARTALEMGRPVILFPQAGGDIQKCHGELMALMHRLIDPDVRQYVVSLNERIVKMDRQQVLAFVDNEFLSCIRTLVRGGMISRYTSYFDAACMEADKEW
jgi:phosphoglycolate phosphatase-like HAD superfamily hydrolase